MVQTHDVSINGAGYTLIPGSYSYRSQGAKVAAVRAGVGSFGQPIAAGASGPVVVDKDAARWAATGMLPLPVGLGDEAGRLVLGPKEQTSGAIGSNFDGNSSAIVYGGVVYIAVGSSLVKVTTASGAWSGLTFIGSAAGVITSMAVINNLLYMACASPATTMSNYAGSGAIVNTPAAQAAVIWNYAQGIWRSKGNDPTTISGSIDGGATWSQWQLDSAVQSVVNWRGRATGGGVVLIGTKDILWELAGQWTGSPAAFSGTVSPVYNSYSGGGLDDFAYLVEYQGDVYTWFAGICHRWDGRHLHPVAGGPRGAITGMASAAGYLIVSVKDAALSRWTIYAFDGVRWAVIETSTGVAYQRVAGTDGLISDGHLLSLDSASQIVSRWELPVGGLIGQPRASGQVVVGPLDGGAGDAIKTWTRVTLPWSTALHPSGVSAPANPGGSVLLEYSVDDGSNYVSLGSTVIAAAARSGFIQVAMPGAGVEAQRLLIRATWTPTSAYAGLMINGLYADGWRIAEEPKVEQWQFDIKCSDRMLKRDGSVDARTGEAMLQALRTLAQSGSTFTFQDIDYDLNARNVTARVVDLHEKSRKGDGTRFLESQVSLTLLAVG